MLVNGEEFNVDKLTEELDFNRNMLQKANDYLELTSYQIEVLNRNKIDYQTVASISSLLYLIEDALEEADDEELELVLEELAERNYYENTKK